MTPKEYKQMMDYLTRSGVKKQVKFASDIARPDPKPVVKEIELFNAFNRRNPKADGGMLVQPGFGGTRQGYAKPKSVEDFSSFKEITQGKRKGQYSIRIGAGDNRKTYYGTIKELQKIFDKEAFKNPGNLKVRGTGTLGGDTRPKDLENKKYSKNYLPRNKFLKFLKSKGIDVKRPDVFAKNYGIDIKPNPYFKGDSIYNISKLNNQNFVDDIIKRQVKSGKGTEEQKIKFREGKEGKRKTEIKRKKSLLETDPTGAKGTEKFQYHHIRQIEGGVPLTTDDVMIINQRINSQLGGETNKTLNRISAAIRKNNRLALEAMNAKEENLALDYMKRVDELNESAEKIVNSAIDKLPKKYKGYVGFNQFTLPRDEYGLPISNEPMIIRKVGGMPVSKDAIDLTTLNLKQEKEFRDLVKTQAQAGKTGQIKGLAAFIKRNFPDGEIVCNLSKGINCNNPQAYQKSINQLTQKAKQGDKAARATLTRFTNLAGNAGKFIRSGLGPLAIASEIAIEGGIALNKTLQTGVPFKTAFADSIFNLALGPKLQIDKEAELKKEFAKGEDFAMAERGRRMMIPQSATADAQRLKEREEERLALFPDLQFANPSNQEIDEVLKEQGVFSPFTAGFGMQRTQPGVGDTKYNEDAAYQEIRDLINKNIDERIQSQQMQNIATAGGIANLAGGGIAGLSGGKKSGPPPISGPTPDGDEGLPAAFKNVRKR